MWFLNIENGVCNLMTMYKDLTLTVPSFVNTMELLHMYMPIGDEGVNRVLSVPTSVNTN